MLLVLSLVEPALAQELPSLDAQLFRPSVDARYTLWTDDSGSRDDEAVTVRAFVGYADDPLVFEAADGTRTDALDGVSTLDLAASWRFAPSFRLGARVPLVLGSSGDLAASGGGLGDVGVELAGLLFDRAHSGVGFAVVGGLTGPTATLDAPLSSPGVTWWAGGVTDLDVGDGRLAVNVGHRSVPDPGSAYTEWDDQVYGRIGYGVPVTDAFGVSAELAAHIAYAAQDGQAAPVEGLGGAWFAVAPDWRVQAGVGAGLSTALGAPQFRALAGLVYQPGPTVEEVAPAVVEVVPPPPPPVALGTLGFSITGPDGAVSGASFELDHEGAWRPIASGEDHAVAPGAHVVRVRAPGFAPTRIEIDVAQGLHSELAVVLVPSKVKVTAERIEISEKVFFETGAAVILSASHPLLAQVAEVLQDHRDIASVRVEGHTDNRGSEASNLELSQARADAVADWLVAAGVASERLEAVGFGETRPVQDEESEAAWSRNRRVEFVIVARGD